ncbi:hypothetical protein PR202_ga25165 [Eleusine coracana subsp. coracana]|uniref:DUF1618 domain-containing protein n=1 Tax=Eleusine coracana subsp. coracana TaxID=191504 RepID=A0AAV5DAM8_ELECO|nr:hypothetical protein PR202_ga25165 [Eleusine coracana subsp. coracana]
MLIMVALEQGFEKSRDYLVYNAGNAVQPPSLSLLPPCYRYLVSDSTGMLLRHGEDELVVARLEIVTPNDKTPKEHHVADKCVIPVGDDMLCWVWTHQGLILCNVFDENNLVLRYVPLPKDDATSCGTGISSSGNVCVTSQCKHSKNCFIIKTWKLRMDSMTWVLDGIMDSSEMWALHTYDKSLPRVRPEYPVVSMDDPHIICFMLQHEKEWWLIMLHKRSKMLRSVCRSYPTVDESKKTYPGVLLLHSKVSYYLNNSYPDDSSISQIDVQPPPLAIVDEQQTSDDHPTPNLLVARRLLDLLCMHQRFLRHFKTYLAMACRMTLR